jgi:hypothetical protein
MPAHFAKHDTLMASTTIDVGLRSPVERVLQTYAIPLAVLAAGHAEFDPASLDAVAILIDRSTAGGLWIAEVALE